MPLIQLWPNLAKQYANAFQFVLRTHLTVNQEVARILGATLVLGDHIDLKGSFARNAQASLGHCKSCRWPVACFRVFTTLEPAR